MWSLMSEWLHKEILERRAHGLEGVVGESLEIEWGHDPEINGTTIYLPKHFEGIWSSRDIIQGVFDHLVAHAMFDSNSDLMRSWVDTWSADGGKITCPDPYCVIEEAARTVVKTLESIRVESMFGDVYHGSNVRFQKHLRAAFDYEVYSPARALHALYCTEGPLNPRSGVYHEVVDEWGEEDMEYFREKLRDVQPGTIDTTIATAEEFMQTVLPWYESKIRDELEDNHLRKIAAQFEEAVDAIRELEEKKRTTNVMRSEAKEIEEELEKARQAKHSAEEMIEEHDINALSDLSQRESTPYSLNDYTPMIPNSPIDPTDVDHEETVAEAQKMINDVKEQYSIETSESNYDPALQDIEIVESTPRGISMGKVYESFYRDYLKEFSAMYGRRSTELYEYGKRLNVGAYLEDRFSQGFTGEYWERSISSQGFTVCLLMDMSISMLGKRINVCRNVATTLYTVFEELDSQFGIDIDYTVIGYGGGNSSKTMKVVVAQSIDEVKRLDWDVEYQSTPSSYAIRYALAHMENMGSNQLLVHVTDGLPNGFGDESEVPVGRHLTHARRAVESASNEVDVFTVGIDMRLTDERMREVYGDYVNVDTDSNIQATLLDIISENFAEYLSSL